VTSHTGCAQHGVTRFQTRSNSSEASLGEIQPIAEHLAQILLRLLVVEAGNIVDHVVRHAVDDHGEDLVRLMRMLGDLFAHMYSYRDLNRACALVAAETDVDARDVFMITIGLDDVVVNLLKLLTRRVGYEFSLVTRQL
jgi:hypothetical protein